MTTLLGLLVISVVFAHIGLWSDKEDIEKLQKQVQDLQDVIRRRQIGQSWERIRRDDEELRQEKRSEGYTIKSNSQYWQFGRRLKGNT